VADTFYYSGMVVAGRDDALLSISNVTDTTIEDGRRRFRLKSLNVSPVRTSASAAAVPAKFAFGRYLGFAEGGYNVPVVKPDTAEADLPAGVKIKTMALISAGSDDPQNIFNGVDGIPDYLSGFSSFQGSRRLMTPYGVNNLTLLSPGPLSSNGTSTSMLIDYRKRISDIQPFSISTGQGFAVVLSEADASAHSPAGVWNANVVIDIGVNSYLMCFDFVLGGSGVATPNTVDEYKTYIAPFVIKNDEPGTTIVIESIEITYAGPNTTVTALVDQPMLRLCKIGGVGGGEAISLAAADSSVTQPTQLQAKVSRHWAPLTASLAVNGLSPEGDLGYPQTNQGIVRRIGNLGRRLTFQGYDSSVGFTMGNTPNFGCATQRGWEWSYDKAPIIDPGEALALIQENATAFGAWQIDLVLWSEPPPAVTGGETSYTFIG